jgi:hypothetical protein
MLLGMAVAAVAVAQLVPRSGGAAAMVAGMFVGMVWGMAATLGLAQRLRRPGPAAANPLKPCGTRL